MKIELCVASLEGAKLAKELGVDRIETCISLEQGGLTPTQAMVSWIHDNYALEQHPLIRLRAGGFTYSNEEHVVMCKQIKNLACTAGVSGFVVGALNADKQLDFKQLQDYMKAAPTHSFTFHRAFDQIEDWKTAMDQLIDLGFKRILTSGCKHAVDQGLDQLRAYLEHAAGRIEIMAGGGVSIENVSTLRQLGVNAIHFSGTSPQIVEKDSAFEETLLIPDSAKAVAILNKLRG